MKFSVVQLITFEIDVQLDLDEGSDMARTPTEGRLDVACAQAARQLSFRAPGPWDGSASSTTTIQDDEWGPMEVSVARVSGQDLIHLLADRRRIHSENKRLRTRTGALESWINAQLRGEADPAIRLEGLSVGGELAVVRRRSKPNEDPEEMQG